MNGPNVNWRFSKGAHREQFGGTQLIVVGSCGLHTLHNACKHGFSMWQLEKVLRALHMLFHNVPARREDFTALTKCIKFPLHSWLTNLPVVERALEGWSSVTMCMDAVMKKKLPNPGTASYDILEVAEKHHLILAKLHFYMAITRTFSGFFFKLCRLSMFCLWRLFKTFLISCRMKFKTNFITNLQTIPPIPILNTHCLLTYRKSETTINCKT